MAFLKDQIMLSGLWELDARAAAGAAAAAPDAGAWAREPVHAAVSACAVMTVAGIETQANRKTQNHTRTRETQESFLRPPLSGRASETES